MCKILKNILLSLGFILFLGKVSVFADGVDILINGQKFNLGNGAIIDNGRVMIPLREIYDLGKYKIIQDEDKGTIRIEKGFKYVQFIIGVDKIVFNNKEKYIDVKPITMYNRSYLPLRALEEALGNEIWWDKERKAVIITCDDSDLKFDFDEEVKAKKIAMEYYGEDVVFFERTSFGEDECYVFAKIRKPNVPCIAIRRDGRKIYVIEEDYSVYKIQGTILFNEI